MNNKMNLLKIILLFHLIKTTILEIEIVSIDWQKYINSSNLIAFDKKIKSLNGLLTNFTYLKSIDLSNNRIEQIDSLQNLKSLQYLDLSNNQLKEINLLQHLTSLEILHLSQNQITKIDSLKYLISLTKLYLSFNQIKEIE